MRVSSLAFFILVLTLCATLPGRAQQDAATIVGEVTDASRGVVPKAGVSVTHTATGITTTTETNERGLFSVPGLRPGEYVVIVEAPGFSKFVRTGVLLQVAQTLQLDAGLQTGSVQESVEVTGAAPMLETQTSSRGLVIDERKILDLPLNGRDYNQLALLSPGVLPGTPRLASVNFKAY